MNTPLFPIVFSKQLIVVKCLKRFCPKQEHPCEPILKRHLVVEIYDFLWNSKISFVFHREHKEMKLKSCSRGLFVQLWESFHHLPPWHLPSYLKCNFVWKEAFLMELISLYHCPFGCLQETAMEVSLVFGRKFK